LAFTRRSYEEIRDSILSQLTKGIINEKHTYEPNRTRYKLANNPVKEIVKVDGMLGGAHYTFSSGEDYQQIGDFIEWISEGDAPDEQTAFFVNYTFGEPTGVTDINPGSVVRTIAEAISREIDFLYAQLNHVYLAGFIDTARGSALDLVVSILGVERKPAEHATGKVTFGRNTEPGEVNIENETYVQDGKASYDLKNSPVKSIVKIEGLLNGELYTFEEDVDYILSGNSVEWLAEGKKPDLDALVYVDYLIYEQIEIPEGTRVSTYSRRPEELKVYHTTERSFIEKTPEGRWEVDVPVRASVAGRAGNVIAGSVIVMPQPLLGVEYVINRVDILNGIDDETDNELRERAKHALEVAGKATLVSLHSAVRGVEGVSSVKIEDMPDGVTGVIKIIADGGESSEIEKVINETRAAGIKVEFSRPSPIYIDMNMTITLEVNMTSSKVSREVEAKIRGYISSLDIGDNLVFSRILGVVLGVDGVYDVSEITINAYRRDEAEATTSTRENIGIRAEERAIAREINILIKRLENR